MGQDLTARQDEIRSTFIDRWNAETNLKRLENLLKGTGVSVEAFGAVVMRAVQEKPDLLAVDDRTSLFLACQNAAQDGLMPDRREGALVIYNENRGTYDQPRWTTVVQWQPMIGGLRKKLADLGFDIRAELVYKNDHFDYVLGDHPHINHTRVALGEDRGELIGAYAIATHIQSGRIYRDVMTLEELDAVKKASKAKKGPWTGDFKGEMYRKAVSKRLIKALPLPSKVSEMAHRQLNEIIERDNKQYEFVDSLPPPSDHARQIQEAARRAAAGETVPAGSEGPAPDGVEFEGQEPDF